MKGVKGEGDNARLLRTGTISAGAGLIRACQRHHRTGRQIVFPRSNRPLYLLKLSCPLTSPN